MAAANETVGLEESNGATVRLVVWGVVWLAALAAARLGPDLIWASHPVASWIDAAGLLAIELDLAVFATLLAAVYLVASFVGRIRYR